MAAGTTISHESKNIVVIEALNTTIPTDVRAIIASITNKEYLNEGIFLSVFIFIVQILLKYF
ncbi:hypothetical protein HMPREF9945_01387 [Clostridioides difficile 70-100-2010]|nr:hypothetical protein HMPREF9945_01387 [Clostridioides difficile 70-100-2010]